MVRIVIEFLRHICVLLSNVCTHLYKGIVTVLATIMQFKKALLFGLFHIHTCIEASHTSRSEDWKEAAGYACRIPVVKTA